MKSRLRKILSKKFSGNTLLETVIAMTIIMFVMLLATRIIVSLDKSSNSSLQLKAFVLGRNEINRTTEINEIEEGIDKHGNLIVERKIINTNESNSIKLFVVTVTNVKKSKIVEFKKLIEINESN